MNDASDPVDPGMPPPDAHLRAALRHAPDRDLQPPRALSAHILAEARRAVAPPPWPQRFWAWLARPVPAGAFSSLLLAGFIGLMWREGPPPEAVGPETVAQAPQTASVPQALEEPQATPAQSTPPVSSANGQAASREQAARAKEQVAKARSAAPPPELGAGEAPSASAREDRTPESIVVPPPPPPPAPDQGPAAPEAGATPPAMATSRAEPSATPAPLARDDAPAGLAPRRLMGSANASRAPPGGPDPLAASLAAWRSAGPESAASRRWWEDLRARTLGRWRLADPVDGVGVILLTGPDGQPLGRLRWEPAAVRWQPTGDARGWRAALPAADVEQLREALPR